jgi:hypothetical protein
MKMWVAACAMALAALTEPATVTGTWNMGLQGDHVVQVALILRQEATSVTGTVAMPGRRVGDHVEFNLSGDFVENQLTLSGTMEHGSEAAKVSITASLKDDGTLEGTVMTPHGRVPFTAEKLRGQQ